MQDDKTFLRITNADVYAEIKASRADIADLKKHVLITNGKVKLNRWIATTALSLVTAVLLFLSLKGG